MFQSGTRLHPPGSVLLALSGGLLVVAGGLFAGYFVLGSRNEARAATVTR